MAVRFKVRAPTEAVYQLVLQTLEGNSKVMLKDPKRRSVAVEELTEDLRTRVENEGATVVPDERYDMDGPAR